MGRERQWVSDISAKGMGIDEVYVIKRKDPPRKGRKANHFFALTVSDATGEIRVNYWGNSEEATVRRVYDSVHEGELVRVKGISDQFNGSMVVQVNISNGEDLLEEAREGGYDPADFVACTEKDPEEMYAELQALLSQIVDVDIRSVLGQLFGDQDLVRRFKAAPASVSYHCAWVGGLLEHTLNVARACDFISRLYPELDRDLLLASAVLHDIGKVSCYNVSTTITESVSGRLLGHIVIGAQMVEDACNRCQTVPPALRTKLVHMVLASHGTNEKGSPTEAAIPEALALNFADEMDAKLERFIRARGNGGPEDTFVVDRSLGTKIYLG
ncbi:MAG: HD domain-containing protein [Methanomassiliicoccus sp.]|nr:HD domain-containing protein [Methanomassiliicoccus sp.]